MSSLMRASSLDQRAAGHRGRLGDAEEVEGRGGDVGEDAAAAKGEALLGDDQGDRVQRVGGVRGPVGLEHVVAVAVVGRYEEGAAAGLDRLDDAAELGVDGLQGLD